MKKFLSLVTFSTLPAALFACGAGMEDCGMHGGAPGGHATVYLALLGLGYWLLTQAERETKKNLKVLGRTVSAVILLGSLFGLLCPILFHCASHRGGAMMCAKDGAPRSCPFMGSSTVAPAAPAPAVEAPAAPPEKPKKK